MGIQSKKHRLEASKCFFRGDGTAEVHTSEDRDETDDDKLEIGNVGLKCVIEPAAQAVGTRAGGGEAKATRDILAYGLIVEER